MKMMRENLTEAEEGMKVNGEAANMLKQRNIMLESELRSIQNEYSDYMEQQEEQLMDLLDELKTKELASAALEAERTEAMAEREAIHGQELDHTQEAYLRAK